MIDELASRWNNQTTHLLCHYSFRNSQKLMRINRVFATRTLSEVFTYPCVRFQVYKVKDTELQVGTLLEAVMGRMASKDFVNY